ncbi:MAG: hydrolase, partial [Eubacteriales bacterium]|nr:hydrolase [Eubacteriales bacterium]
IDAETGENFTYVSTIDEQTYNRVKLIYDDEEDGVRHVYVSQDKATMAKWGTLAYFEKLTTSENAKLKADTLLKLYNTKTKNLRLRDCLGDMRVRAGSTIVVQLDLGDVKLSNYMLVEKCTHRFKDNEHTMDLTLRGGEFIA